jgi:hypothetical protein
MFDNNISNQQTVSSGCNFHKSTVTLSAAFYDERIWYIELFNIVSSPKVQKCKMKANLK